MHTDEEYCRLDTLVPRAQAVAATLLDLCDLPGESTKSPVSA